ncbi:MAG: hypothetical protein Q8S13_10955, partial [Dehalococcoidia bacterium]|nr:hypothetical protein [Dehalococcoidia bacterium]
GRIVIVGTRALRPTYVNGRLVTAGYLGDLRLRPEHRGGTAIARGYRYLESLHRDGRAEIYSSVIVADNRLALDTIAANRAGMPRYADLGRILTPMIYLRRRQRPIDGEIVRGGLDLLHAIVAKLNENRGQFAPAWTESDFLDGRLRGFRLEDFYVLRRGGHVAGVLGTWDQSSFRQTVAMRYNGVLGALRPIINLVRRPPLPAPGQPLMFFYVAFISTDDEDAFRTLLRRVYNDAIGGPYSHFIVGLHERDPRARVLDEYAHMPFAGRLFAVTFGASAQLDDRVPHVEAALL